MKFKKFFVGFLLYIVVLLVVYVVHIKFFKVDVVFYSSIFDGVFSALICTLSLYVLKYFSVFSFFEKIQMCIIYILSGYIFAISVPTVIDRSLSFYILEKIQQRGGGIKKSGFKDVFTKEYVVEDRLVDVRLTEQLESGTIKIVNNCVKLTKKGKFLASASRFFKKNFLPKKRLLMGEYSSDLTDPFGHGAIDKNATFDYICK